MTINEIKTALDAVPARSAWNRGVKVYAMELLDVLSDFDLASFENTQILRSLLLNGADNWATYSYGGSALIFNGDIAARLCTPSELKRTRDGELNPNSRETWLDVQARALFQAANMIIRVYKNCANRP